jgi:hypothetical protein
MPRFDGTGPWGLGPGTGWGLGPCGAGMAWRRGWGRGFGWRRFWGYPYQFQISEKEEKEILEQDAKDLEEELKAIKERLSQLKGQK